jgi:hypothetical protein
MLRTPFTQQPLQSTISIAVPKPTDSPEDVKSTLRFSTPEVKIGAVAQNACGLFPEVQLGI